MISTLGTHVHKKTGKLYYVVDDEPQVMPNIEDRDISDTNAWANVDLASFDAAGDLSITASGIGQYCGLPRPRPDGRRPQVPAPVDVANSFDLDDQGRDGAQTSRRSPRTGGTDLRVRGHHGRRFIIVADTGTSSANLDNFALYDITATSMSGKATQRSSGEYTWKSKKYLLP